MYLLAFAVASGKVVLRVVPEGKDVRRGKPREDACLWQFFRRVRRELAAVLWGNFFYIFVQGKECKRRDTINDMTDECWRIGQVSKRSTPSEDGSWEGGLMADLGSLVLDVLHPTTTTR